MSSNILDLEPERSWSAVHAESEAADEGKAGRHAITDGTRSASVNGNEISQTDLLHRHRIDIDDQIFSITSLIYLVDISLSVLINM
jgi:hypothetical protein